MKTIIMLIVSLFLSVPAHADTCIKLATPRTIPVYATHVCVDAFSVHDMSRQMSVRLSVGYYEDAIWHETGDKHIRLADTPAQGTEGEDGYQPADLKFTAMEQAFKAIDPKTTKPSTWILGLVQAMYPDELAGVIE